MRLSCQVKGRRAGARTHGEAPRADPEASRPGQAGFRVVPDGGAAPRRGNLGAMTTTPPDAPAGPPRSPRGRGPPAKSSGARPDPPHHRARPQGRRCGRRPGPAPRHRPGHPAGRRSWCSSSSAGPALIAYGACWLLVPEDSATDAPLGLDDRNRGSRWSASACSPRCSCSATRWATTSSPGRWRSIGVIAFFVLGSRPRPPAPADRPAGPPRPDPTAEPSPRRAPARPPAPPAYRPLPRNPRKRGPILFWFTLALAALGVGVLGILDLAGAPIADPAYPAWSSASAA